MLSGSITERTSTGSRAAHSISGHDVVIALLDAEDVALRVGHDVVVLPPWSPGFVVLADHRSTESDQPLHLGVDLVVLSPAAVADVDVEVHHVGQELLIGS
jgi:hypothetical protein